MVKIICGACFSLMMLYGVSAQADEAMAPSLAQVMAQTDYQSVWRQTVQGEQGLPAWVRSGQGTSAPPQTLSWQGKDYLVGSVCQPHNCGNQQLFVVFSADRRHAWGLRVMLPDSEAAMLHPSRYARFQWLGKPDKTIQALLMHQVEGQPDWQ